MMLATIENIPHNMKEAAQQFVEFGMTSLPAHAAIWNVVADINPGFSSFLRMPTKHKQLLISDRFVDGRGDIDGGYCATNGELVTNSVKGSDGFSDLKERFHAYLRILQEFLEKGFTLTEAEVDWLTACDTMHGHMRDLLHPLYHEIGQLVDAPTLATDIAECAAEGANLRMLQYKRQRDEIAVSKALAQIGRSHLDKGIATTWIWSGLSDGRPDPYSQLQFYRGVHILSADACERLSEEEQDAVARLRDQDEENWHTLTAIPGRVIVFASALAEQRFGLQAQWHRIMQERTLQEAARRTFVFFDRTGEKLQQNTH